MTLNPQLEACLDRIIQQVNDRSIALHPPLSETEIVDFEDRHRITLPPGYRAFLQLVGNGGRGPHDLFRLGDYRDGAVPKQEYVDLRDIAKPFPFTEMMFWGDSMYLPEEWPTLHYGNICLSDGGCAMHLLLVITGPERGNVWELAEDAGIGQAGPEPEFLAWYESWLDSDDSRPVSFSTPKRTWWKFW